MDKRGSILVVDDSGFNTKYISVILSQEYDLATANNGIDAIRQAIELNPDLILLDVVMPGMDGYEVCKILKSMDSTKEIPVLFITSMDELSSQTKGFEVGAIDYIVKPFNEILLKMRIANHMELKRCHDQLKLISHLDELTGLYNRRRFNEVMDNEWNRAMRAGGSLAAVMVDIDWFKSFNDLYGHLKGDECLRNIAGTLKTLARRSGDFICRYGGEEFVVVLPTLDTDHAFIVADAVCQGIYDRRIQNMGSKYGHITVSCGVAAVVPEQGQKYESLLIQADEALYMAKHFGRNRVEVFNEQNRQVRV